MHNLETSNKKSHQKYLSVVIPLYQSAHILNYSIQSLINTLDGLHIDYEILLRDDESKDTTKLELDRILEKYSRVRIFSNSQNQGLGFTLRKLFEDSRGEFVIYLDCDLPFGAEVLPIFLENAKEQDIVVASRYLGKRNNVSLKRKLVSRLYFILCKILFRVSIRDIGSGSVLFRREVLQRMNLEAKGFDIHIEWFVMAKKNRYRVKEVAVATDSRGESTFSILKHGPQIVIDTIRLWFRKKQKVI